MYYERNSLDIGENIKSEIALVTLLYASARLVTDLPSENQPELVNIFFKLYQQSPHAKPGEVKSDDPSRFIEVSAMHPGEWYEYPESGMSTTQADGINHLWVYDQTYHPCTLEEYLIHFYNDLYDKGFSIGYSPMATFINSNKVVTARCLQLDLECNEFEVQRALNELCLSLKVDSIPGVVVRSSSQATHFHTNQYFEYDNLGRLKLGQILGTSLLLNKEKVKPVVDSRSIGHQIRSLTEPWENWIENAETGCLRITQSTLKREHPEIIDFTM
jgi:hypothetical protein